MAEQVPTRAQIVGHVIQRVLQSDWQIVKGIEISGLCSENWQYCNWYVELENQVFFELGPRADDWPIRLIDYDGRVVSTLHSVDDQRVVGARIVEVVADAISSEIFIYLDNGLFLTNYDDVGGNSLHLRDDADLDYLEHGLVTYWGREPISREELSRRRIA